MKRRHSSLSASNYSGVILKRIPYMYDSGSNTAHPDTQSNIVGPKGRWETLRTRSIYGTGMIFGLYLALLSGPIAIILLIAAIQTLVFKEVISIAHFRSQEKKLPWFRSITWYETFDYIHMFAKSDRYFLFCTNYFLYGESFAEHFKIRIFTDAFLANVVAHHHFISFFLYVLGI